jgi:OOP family OmpA-OmpF porin
MRKLQLAAALASALALSAPASAGFFDFTLAPYVGFGIGQSKADLSCSAGISCDDTSTIGKAYIGLEMNEYISMEVGYIDMGTFKYSGVKSGTREVHGMLVNVLGTYSINPSFKLLGSAGFGILDTKLHGTIAGSSGDVGDNDLEWTIGVGAQYNITQALGVRAQLERYHKVGSPLLTNGNPIGTGQVDIDLLTAGLVYKF